LYPATEEETSHVWVPSVAVRHQGERRRALDIPWSALTCATVAKRAPGYYQGVFSAVDKDGGKYEVLGVLPQDVAIRALFCGWPATVTYYANSMGL
jgi:hypothetical protein